MLDKYIVCPCTGELPFLVNDVETAFKYVITEEYHAVRLSDMKLVNYDDGSIGDQLKIKES